MVEVKSGGSRAGPNILKERKFSCLRHEWGHILSVALSVTLLLPRLSFPGSNNRIFVAKNCSYGTDRTWNRSFFFGVYLMSRNFMLRVAATC
jgi:hypothetical protein